MMNTPTDRFYVLNGERPVAYIDESYDTDPSHPHSFYILTAVVVENDQRDALRSGLVGIAASSYWHTSEAMRDVSGRSRVHKLLDYLADDAGSERCVISVLQHIQPGDETGDLAREQAFRKLYQELTPNIRLFVLERRRTSRARNIDADIKKRAVSDRLCPPSTRLLQISPGTEQLLWLPDLVCSAYRQRILGRDATYFEHISEITRII